MKKIEANTCYDDYEDSFFWLSDAKVTNECFLCSDPNVGLALNEVRSYIKCYLGDTGLLISQTFNEAEIDSSNIK